MIAVLGINHKTADVHIRESFFISPRKVGPLAEEILQKTEIQEILIFSTCNRTEVYYYSKGECHKTETRKILEILHEFLNCKQDYSDVFYTWKKTAAIKHLFRVTSGADSMLLGEAQIVGQIKEAYLLCTSLALTDAVLMRLFQKAFEVSKRVRSETNIQKGATSISYVAIDMCVDKVENIKEKKILIIGAGEIARKALNHLKKKGCENFIIVNRTLETAKQLAAENGGTAVAFEKFPEYLPGCDIVIAATNAGRHLITRQDIISYAGNPGSAHQVLIDLSVPRNIDESAGNLENICLIGVDDLQSVTDKTAELRTGSLDHAEQIIDEMTGGFLEWYNNRKLRSIIKTITKNIQNVHEQELSNSRKCYSAEEYSLVKEYGGRLSQKYTRLLIRSLKKLSNGSHDPAALKNIKDLFEINDDNNV